MKYKQRHPESVDAFLYGIDEEPDWFRECIKNGLIYEQSQDQKINHYIRLPKPTEAILIEHNDMVFITENQVIGCLSKEMFDHRYEPITH